MDLYVNTPNKWKCFTVWATLVWKWVTDMIEPSFQVILSGVIVATQLPSGQNVKSNHLHFSFHGFYALF